MPTKVNPELTAQGIDGRITGYNNGKTQVELAPGAHPNDSAVHDLYARQVRGETSVTSRVADRMKNLLGQGADVRPGSARWELTTEAAKHRDMADWRFREAEKLPAASRDRTRLLQEAHDYERLAGEYEQSALRADPTERPSDANIEARKRSYANHDEIQGLLGKPYDRASLPEHYVTFEVEGGRKVATRLKSGGTFDLDSAVLLVRPDGTVHVNPQNRVTYDYLELYRNHPDARADIDFGRDGYTLHHIIPDKVSTQDPLCVKATELVAYSPDRMSNYRPMPMEKLFRQLDGQEVGHWSNHSEYDATVVRAALAERRAIMEIDYGPLSTWNESHHQIREIKADLAENMRSVEKSLLNRIENGEVPMVIYDNISGPKGRIR